MTASPTANTGALLDRVYHCLACGRTWKNVHLELWVQGVMVQPTCPECCYWMMPNNVQVGDAP